DSLVFPNSTYQRLSAFFFPAALSTAELIWTRMRGHLDCAHGAGVGSGASVLSASERVAGGGRLRRVCRGAVCEVLCGQVRTAVASAGDLLPVAADRVFRGPRQRAWDRLAVGGFAGAAALCGHRARRVHAGPLDDFAHAAVDRSGHASGSVRL